MRVLVTGATGFVGRALLPVLLEQGHTVRAATRGPAELPRGVEAVIVGDIGPDTDWSRAVEGMDAVVHSAARVHQMRDKEADPLAVYRAVNTEGTRRLAAAAAAAGVRRFVFLSSVKAVTDSGQDAPLRDDTPATPTDPYGRSKLEAEQALAALAARTGLEVVVFRPPLIYGPGVKANFESLLRICARGTRLPFGGIENRRSMLFVGNLAHAIATALIHEAAPGRTFLIHDGKALSTAELIERLGRALGTPARLITIPPFLLAVAARLPILSRIVQRVAGSLHVDDLSLRRELGWRPPFTQDQALARTAAWFRAEQARRAG